MLLANVVIKNFIRILFTIFLFLFVVIFSIKVALNFRPLYYFDIKYFNIQKYTFLNQKQIKSAYNYLINYINTPSMTHFKIPLLPSSKTAIIHFHEVKNLFNKLNVILFISTLISIISIYLGRKYKDFSFLRWCSNLLLYTVLFIAVSFYLNFDKSFRFFHSIFFHNNYWLLNPETDPVINLLPEEYFFHCAVLILIIIFIWIVIFKIIYFKNRIPKKSK
jgi:integral membrane protein (TIGR01906 family)